MPVRRLAPQGPGAHFGEPRAAPQVLQLGVRLMGTVLGIELGVGGRGGVCQFRHGGRRRTGGGAHHGQGSI
jgi:hypothetical protein